MGETIEIFIVVTIYFTIPVMALILYFRLVKQIRDKRVTNPPFTDLFIIFGTYGGLLLVTFTSLFWIWSGMASVGIFYLILLAPVIMGLIAWRNYKRRRISIYHNASFILGLTYIGIVPLIFVILYSIGYV